MCLKSSPFQSGLDHIRQNGEDWNQRVSWCFLFCSHLVILVSWCPLRWICLQDRLTVKLSLEPRECRSFMSLVLKSVQTNKVAFINRNINGTGNANLWKYNKNKFLFYWCLASSVSRIQNPQVHLPPSCLKHDTLASCVFGILWLIKWALEVSDECGAASSRHTSPQLYATFSIFSFNFSSDKRARTEKPSFPKSLSIQ